MPVFSMNNHDVYDEAQADLFYETVHAFMLTQDAMMSDKGPLSFDGVLVDVQTIVFTALDYALEGHVNLQFPSIINELFMLHYQKALERDREGQQEGDEMPSTWDFIKFKADFEYFMSGRVDEFAQDCIRSWKNKKIAAIGEPTFAARLVNSGLKTEDQGLDEAMQGLQDDLKSGLTQAVSGRYADVDHESTLYKRMYVQKKEASLDDAIVCVKSCMGLLKKSLNLVRPLGDLLVSDAELMSARALLNTQWGNYASGPEEEYFEDLKHRLKEGLLEIDPSARNFEELTKNKIGSVFKNWLKDLYANNPSYAASSAAFDFTEVMFDERKLTPGDKKSLQLELSKLKKHLVVAEEAEKDLQGGRSQGNGFMLAPAVATQGTRGGWPFNGFQRFLRGRAGRERGTAMQNIRAAYPNLNLGTH